MRFVNVDRFKPIRLRFLLAVLTAMLVAGPGTAGAGEADADQGKLVIIGASYAQDWPVEQLAGMRVVNRGVGGEQSHEVRARFERDALAEAPNAVLIWGYINDIHNAPDDDMEAVRERARASIMAMVEAARERGVRPIVTTEVTVRDSADGWLQNVKHTIGGLIGKESYRGMVNGQVHQLNDWLRDYARRENLLLLDIQPVLSDKNGVRRKPFAKDDGSHLTEAAYVELSRFAERELAQALQ